MQTNVAKLQAIFPNAKITTSGRQVKAHVNDLLNDDFDKLSALKQAGNDVIGKRSGKGITIIVSPVQKKEEWILVDKTANTRTRFVDSMGDLVSSKDLAKVFDSREDAVFYATQAGWDWAVAGNKDWY